MAPSFLPATIASLVLRDANTGPARGDVTCPKPLPDEDGLPLFGKGSVNLHQFMIYVSGGCLIVTIISSVLLSWRHLHRYTSPNEQRQILRIINLPVFYCLFNFLAVWLVMNYMWIEPIGGVYEAFTVAATFLLVLEWVCPDGTDREKYFDLLENRSRSKKPIPGGSLKWFQRTWSQALQYPLTKTVFVIIQCITQYYGDYCEGSFSPKHAHLYLQLADLLFVGGALGATIRFFGRLKAEIAPIHRGPAKVWSLIGIVAFQVIQGLIFHLLNGKLFQPSDTATYNDINFGISSFMTCIESVIFSLIFHWSYSAGEYKEGQKIDRYGIGPAQRTRTFKAIFDALNLSDIVAGTILAFQLLFMRVQSRYGARSGDAQSQKTLRAEDQVHLEPLSDRSNVRGYDNQAMETEYEGQTQYYPGYAAPPMPQAARDPSPGAAQGRNQTFRADDMRPELERQDSYSRRGYARGNTPESVPLQHPREMM